MVTIGGFSAHGGQPFLVEYALASRKNLKRVFLVRGEELGAQPLMDKLNQAGLERVDFPSLHSRVEI